MEEINHGLLLGRRETDYLGGTLPYEVRTQSGDWRKFLPKGEKQRPNAVDVMACVTFSDLSSLEIQTIQQGKPEINFSDRFTAKMSGTTRNGNWLYAVADSVRKDGIVLESEYPTPSGFTWDSYYAEIPQPIKDKAIHPDIAYEWVFKKDFAYHLKHAPLQITIPEPSPNHAVVLVYMEGNTGYYFDSYSPFLKTIDMSKVSDAALKIVLTNTSMNDNIVIYKHGNEYQLANKAKSEEGFAQQLFDSGATNLLTTEGKPNFVEIDKIAKNV